MRRQLITELLDVDITAQRLDIKTGCLFSTVKYNSVRSRLQFHMPMCSCRTYKQLHCSIMIKQTDLQKMPTFYTQVGNTCQLKGDTLKDKSNILLSIYQ